MHCLFGHTYPELSDGVTAYIEEQESENLLAVEIEPGMTTAFRDVIDSVNAARWLQKHFRQFCYTISLVYKLSYLDYLWDIDLERLLWSEQQMGIYFSLK